MKMIVEGVMESNLPWGLIGIGVCIALMAEIVRIPVLPFAIGIYLPIHLNACIMVGGLVRLFFDKMKRREEEKKRIISDGILFCSGMIAGEGLIGVLLAVLAIIGVSEAIDCSQAMELSPVIRSVGSLVVFGLVVWSLLRFSVWKKRKEK